MNSRSGLLFAVLATAVLFFGCNGADEVTGALRPKSVEQKPPDARIHPVVVEESRDPVEVPARRPASPYPCVVVSNDSAPKNKPCQPCEHVRVGLHPENKPCYED